MLLGADGMHGNCGLGRDGDSILASELFEFIFFSNPPPEIGNNVTHFPHLLLYKVVHAEMLADHGVFGEAQKVCDNVATFIKNAPKGTQFNRVFLERLEHVNARINSIDESASSSGWFGGKLGRPKLDKIWMQSFNKFVAGDDEDVASEASSTDKEGAIFKKLASTPSVSRVESATDLSGQYFSGGTHTPEYGYSHGAAGSRAVSNPYAPAPAAGGGDRPGSLHRIQSYAGLPSAPMGSQYGGLGIQPTSSPVYGPSSTSRRNNFGQDLGGSRPVSPNTSSIARSTSVGGYEEHAPPPSRPGSAGSSSVMNKTAPPPPAVHKPPMTRAYTPENVTIDQNSASAQASPASSLASTSPRRQPPPPRGYNPYAPQAAGHQNGSVRPSSASSNYNPYAPVAPSPKQQQPPEPSTETEDYGVSVDNPYGAIYGGAPPPPLPAAAAEPAEETARPQEATEEEEPRAEPEDTYEPPSYGYQPPPLEEEEVPDAESGGGNLFVPVAGAAAAPIPKAPMPATGHYTPPTAEPIPEENEEEAEDLGVSNAKSETDRIFEEAKRKQDEEDERKRQEQENKKSGKWFSWLRKGDDQQPKAVRAKLGEENSFYYDEKLKRWVNKKAPVEEQKAAAPPPPPKASKTPSTTSTPTGFESSPNPSTGGTPPSGGPPPARPSTGPPKPSTGGGLDDLLAAAPASGAKKHARRSARNRYVDIMQK
ncbi:hypothetical protein TRICI_000923 [Trichomonascus ciferrii]|uniref:COPII coat assembly protein SEC16 n=1 Tax=Trichomonascus ciferrii TaxID=44093 RepID=A0A642VBU4_9ASCO|nr:hypothetical protein TRICI_000923 [Trichomonascus ciferrii]